MKNKKSLSKHSKKHLKKIKDFEYKSIFILGTIIFLIGTILNTMYLWIPGFMLLIIGLINRHSWDIKHK